MATTGTAPGSANARSTTLLTLRGPPVTSNVDTRWGKRPSPQDDHWSLSHATSNVGNISQRAALAAVSGDLSAVAEMRTAFARRAALMHTMLNEIPGVTCIEPQGAFYCFPNVSGLLGRPIAFLASMTGL